MMKRPDLGERADSNRNAGHPLPASAPALSTEPRRGRVPPRRGLQAGTRGVGGGDRGAPEAAGSPNVEDLSAARLPHALTSQQPLEATSNHLAAGALQQVNRDTSP